MLFKDDNYKSYREKVQEINLRLNAADFEQLALVTNEATYTMHTKGKKIKEKKSIKNKPPSMCIKIRLRLDTSCY